MTLLWRTWATQWLIFSLILFRSFKSFQSFQLDGDRISREIEEVEEWETLDDSPHTVIPIFKRKSTRRSLVQKLRQLDMKVQGVELSDYYNNEYVGLMGVGTPPQFLTVVFDTGSSDIWIPSTRCNTCGSHNAFDETKSSSYEVSTGKKGDSAPFRISYGSGDVEGDIVLETVTLSNLTLPRVKLGIVTSEDDAIADFDMDGICGLAFDGLSVVTKPSILDSMSHTFPNLSHSFSIYLSADPGDLAKPSVITFGGYDLSIVSEEAEFFFTPVIRDTAALTYWTVSLTAFEVGASSVFTTLDEVDVVFSVCAYGSSCLAIIDSGTSGIAIPSEYYDNVVNLVTSGKDCVDLSCVGVSVDDFPVLLVSMEPNNVFPLLPSDYTECSEFGECIVRFQSSSELWILGDAFIETYYTYFDMKNLRVGFACEGTCSGGTWHGHGGYFVLTNDVPLWKRAAFIYSLFVLLLATLMSAINAAWNCFAERTRNSNKRLNGSGSKSPERKDSGRMIKSVHGVTEGAAGSQSPPGSGAGAELGPTRSVRSAQGHQYHLLSTTDPYSHFSTMDISADTGTPRLTEFHKAKIEEHLKSEDEKKKKGSGKRGILPHESYKMKFGTSLV